MITVDGRGEQCPIPVIKTKKAIQALTGAETVQVLVDNETAVQNVTRLGNSVGGKVTSSKKAENEFEILIELGEGAGEKAEAVNAEECVVDKRGNGVVVINTATMGVGNDELGKVLMKGFIFAISQLDELPKTILFYNGGVTLAIEGSTSLEDLKNMEAQGVEIMSCGTCLDYYNVKDKLAVGSITNMYTIVETMDKAGHIIRP